MRSFKKPKHRKQNSTQKIIISFWKKKRNQKSHKVKRLTLIVPFQIFRNIKKRHITIYLVSRFFASLPICVPFLTFHDTKNIYTAFLHSRTTRWNSSFFIVSACLYRREGRPFSFSSPFQVFQCTTAVSSD